nr:hypothetical protein [Rhodopirellula sp. SM50]
MPYLSVVMGFGWCVKKDGRHDARLSSPPTGGVPVDDVGSFRQPVVV